MNFILLEISTDGGDSTDGVYINMDLIQSISIADNGFSILRGKDGYEYRTPETMERVMQLVMIRENAANGY